MSNIKSILLLHNLGQTGKYKQAKQKITQNETNEYRIGKYKYLAIFKKLLMLQYRQSTNMGNMMFGL